MDFIDRLILMRDKFGYTNAELEEKSNISNSQISKWIKNNQKPSYDKVVAVAKTLNVSIDWLLLGKENENLTAEEQELIDLYRKTNDIGQPLITNHAKDIQKALPRQQEIKPEIISSDSKIG